MEQRDLGTSGLRVPSVFLGTWALGGLYWGGSDDKIAVEAIRAGIDAGLTAIDTAPIYGFGRSERVVGEAIRGNGNAVLVATKFGQPWDQGDGKLLYRLADESGTEHSVHLTSRPESVFQECEESLVRLGIDTIGLYQCHVYDSATATDVLMDGMLRLREQGKIRAIGVSGYGAKLMDECLAAGVLHCNQLRYNPLWRTIESKELPACRENNIGVIVYSPLERGLFTGKIDMEREFPSDDKRSALTLFSLKSRSCVLNALEEIRPIAEKYDATIAQLVINWITRVPGITAAIVGVRTPEQGRENAAAMAFTLTDAEWEQMDRVWRKLARKIPKYRMYRLKKFVRHTWHRKFVKR
jgi:aryl-alcohol dehydrogenase-like predicted oxidoreductase